jgi:AAA lid domain
VGLTLWFNGKNVNPGLSRRFAIENAFHFEDFTDAELLEVLNLKLKGQDLGATDSAKGVAIEVLSRSRNRTNFGNAGEVENLLGQAKGRYQTRQSSLPANERGPHIIFEPQDFDPDFNRNAHASTNLQRLFEDVVGCGDIIRRLGEYQRLATALKARGKDPRGEISTNWVFKGPPGMWECGCYLRLGCS